jgi:hypothetical protein
VLRCLRTINSICVVVLEGNDDDDDDLVLLLLLSLTVVVASTTDESFAIDVELALFKLAISLNRLCCCC